jgi:hypothetical protein
MITFFFMKPPVAGTTGAANSHEGKKTRRNVECARDARFVSDAEDDGDKGRRGLVEQRRDIRGRIVSISPTAIPLLEDAIPLQLRR